MLRETWIRVPSASSLSIGGTMQPIPFALSLSIGGTMQPVPFALSLSKGERTHVAPTLQFCKESAN